MTMDQMLERAAPNPGGGARRNPFLQPAAEIAQYTRHAPSPLEHFPLPLPPASSLRACPRRKSVTSMPRPDRMHGIRALYAGAVPLLLRELCYISSITVRVCAFAHGESSTRAAAPPSSFPRAIVLGPSRHILCAQVVNPIATRYIEGGDGGTGGSSYARGTATAFLVGARRSQGASSARVPRTATSSARPARVSPRFKCMRPWSSPVNKLFTRRGDGRAGVGAVPNAERGDEERGEPRAEAPGTSQANIYRRPCGRDAQVAPIPLPCVVSLTWLPGVILFHA
jgi:hypothetical protein